MIGSNLGNHQQTTANGKCNFESGKLTPEPREKTANAGY